MQKRSWSCAARTVHSPAGLPPIILDPRTSGPNCSGKPSALLAGRSWMNFSWASGISPVLTRRAARYTGWFSSAVRPGLGT